MALRGEKANAALEKEHKSVEEEVRNLLTTLLEISGPAAGFTVKEFTDMVWRMLWDTRTLRGEAGLAAWRVPENYKALSS